MSLVAEQWGKSLGSWTLPAQAQPLRPQPQPELPRQPKNLKIAMSAQPLGSLWTSTSPNCHVSTATWFPLNFNQPKLPCQHSHSEYLWTSISPDCHVSRIATLPTQSPVITRDSPSYGEKQSHWKTAHRTESACLNRWCNGVYIKVWQLLS